MFRTVFAATVAVLALAGSAQASTFDWDVAGTQSGSGSTGGTHTVTAANGDGSTIVFSGMPSPSIKATGQTGAVGGRYSNARASYEYSVGITSMNAIARAQLYGYAVISGSDPTPIPIAKASGYLYLAGTSGSYATASVSAPLSGGAQASCDSGDVGDCGLTAYNFDIYYDFDLDCPNGDAQHICGAVISNFTPTLKLTLDVEADVYGGDDEHVFAFVDPTITLNDAFFTKLALDPADFQLSFGAGEGNVASRPDFPGFGGGGVPEPATWSMMLVGFGGLGAALRRRRRIAAFA